MGNLLTSLHTSTIWPKVNFHSNSPGSKHTSEKLPYVDDNDTTPYFDIDDGAPFHIWNVTTPIIVSSERERERTDTAF